MLPANVMLERWYPIASLGLQADNDGKVIDVDPDQSAWQACLRKGDKIDLELTKDRRAVNEMVYVARSSDVHVYVSAFDRGKDTATEGCEVTRAVPKEIRITPVAESLTGAQALTLLADQLAGVAFIVLCAYLVWHHPSLELWGLFLYSIWFNPGQYFVWYANLGDRELIFFDLLQALFQAAGLTGLIIFACCFPHDALVGARRRIVLVAAPLFLLLFRFSYLGFGNFMFGNETETDYRRYYYVAWAAYAIVFAIFLDTLWRERIERGRIKWVLVGVLIGLPCFLFADAYEATSFFSRWDISVPPALLQALYAMNLAVPLAIFHAVRHHRVVNVRFPLTRALVLPAAVLGALVFLHIAEVVLEDFLDVKLGNVKYLSACSMGLLILAMHERVVRLIERCFFPHWPKQKRLLETEAERLPELDVKEAEHLFIEAPTRVLQLTSAALFRRAPDGDFELGESVRWTGGPSRLSANDALVADIGTDPRRLSPRDWKPETFPEGFEAAALAVPIVAAHAVVAIALFGPHKGNEDLASDEIRLITQLARGVAAPYSREARLRERDHSRRRGFADT
jgi:hypothetical protein